MSMIDNKDSRMKSKSTVTHKCPLCGVGEQLFTAEFFYCGKCLDRLKIPRVSPRLHYCDKCGSLLHMNDIYQRLYDGEVEIGFRTIKGTYIQ